MKVIRAEQRVLSMRLAEPFETSFGSQESKECIILRLETEEENGYSECVAGEGPWYSYETVQTAWHMLQEYLIPLVLKNDYESPGQFSAQASRIRGHPMTKAAVEMALWDLVAKRGNVSLSSLLGGAKQKVLSGVSVGIQSSQDRLSSLVEKYLEQGYPRIKVKIKPGWDRKVVSELRRKFPETPLSVDANACYGKDDFEAVCGLDEYGLLMIEQPFSGEDLVLHSRLQSKIKTIVCLDESVSSFYQAEQALELGSCKTINIKPGRVGGLSTAKRIHDLCFAQNIPVWCGGMLETGIGRAHNVALASLPNFGLPSDISASNRYFERDIVEPEFRLNRDGTISVPSGPGIGVQPNGDMIEKFTEKRKAFRRR